MSINSDKLWNLLEKTRTELRSISPTDEINNPSLYFKAEKLRNKITFIVRFLFK